MDGDTDLYRPSYPAGARARLTQTLGISLSTATTVNTVLHISGVAPKQAATALERGEIEVHADGEHETHAPRSA
jgi:hypothetical protein